MGHHPAERDRARARGLRPQGRARPAAERAAGVRRVDTETERAAQPGVFNPTFGSEAAPAAAKGSKKKFVLDPLLD
jgi:hypothetical protein